MKKVDIKDLDKNAFFHYTNKDNLDNIMKNGLEPRIGDNATGIEKNEKVFFTIGITNSLVLMDVWIKWLVAKSGADLPGEKLDKPLYELACFIQQIKVFQPLFRFVVWLELKSKKRINKAYLELKNILDNSVYFALDLEKNIDYSFDNVDEVKNGKFNKNILKLLYSNNSDVKESYMEYWNMHTIPKKTIEPSKISLVTINDSDKASDILEYMRCNSEIKIKKELPYLYGYFKWLNKK